MTEAGFFERQRISPTSLTIVIAMHAAAITALALSKMEVTIKTPSGPFEIFDVPIDRDPPPEPVKTSKPTPAPRTTPTRIPPIVEPPISDDLDLDTDPTPTPAATFDRSGSETIKEPTLPPEPVPPVRIEARMDSRSPLQPPYPASEERAGTEGQVKVRVRIGADGRVKAVERLAATHDAFYRATERHALRAWRFKPATVDGRPIESMKEVIVRFVLPA
jgi:periplasmic protein TonB